MKSEKIGCRIVGMDKCCKYGTHKWKWDGYPCQVRCIICKEFRYGNFDWMDSDGHVEWVKKLKRAGKFVGEKVKSKKKKKVVKKKVVKKKKIVKKNIKFNRFEIMDI